MPHRTTYFFPRQFPDRRFDSSTTSKSASSSTDQKYTVVDEVDRKVSVQVKDNVTAFDTSGFTGDRDSNVRGKQLSAFVNWLADKKKDSNKKASAHVRFSLDSHDRFDEEEHQLLLLPDAAETEAEIQVVEAGKGKDQGFVRQVGKLLYSSYISMYVAVTSDGTRISKHETVGLYSPDECRGGTRISKKICAVKFCVNVTKNNFSTTIFIFK